MSNDQNGALELAARMVHTLPGWGLWAIDVRDFETPYGSIGFRQASILWVLRKAADEEQELTPTGIAKHFGVQNSAITRAVDKLERGGYLTREVAFEDRRRHYLVLTQKGVDISDWIERLFTAPLQEELSELSETDLAKLGEQVEVLNNILSRMRNLPNEADSEPEMEQAAS